MEMLTQSINAMVTQKTEQNVCGLYVGRIIYVVQNTANYLWWWSKCLTLLSNVQQMMSKGHQEASHHVIAAVHDKM